MKLIDCDINVHCLILEGFSDATRVSEFVDDGISYLEAVQYEPKFISYWKGDGDISRNAWFSKYESMKEDMHNYPSFGLYSHGIHGTRDVHCAGSIVKFIRKEGHSLFNMMIYLIVIE